VTGVLIRRADLGGRAPADVRVTGGTVAEIGPQLPARSGEEVLDARGGALLPGLCDHHLHLHAIAAAGQSARCGPPEVTGPGALGAALAAAAPDERGWVRGVGYSEDVAGPLDAAALDRLHAGRPVRIQHRSGALWIVNTAGARALGLAHGTHPGIERDSRSGPTGRLWRADDWLRAQLPRSRPPGLAPVGARLARLGITHVTDATPDLDTVAIDAISAAMRTAALPQHVQLLGVPLDWTAPARPPAPAAGPYKIVLADSGLPGLEPLTDRIRAAHASGRGVAAHCVTREALVLLVAALELAAAADAEPGGTTGLAGTADAGPVTLAAPGVGATPRPGDRIEHAALVPAGMIPRLRDLGLRVVTQPGFLACRGDDYLRDVPASDHADLYRARSLVEGGVPCALSSDAPYGPLDPWAVMAAAMLRRTPSGRVAGAGEQLTPEQALAGYLSRPDQPGGPPRTVRPGSPADLVLLRVSRTEALNTLDADLVAATLIGGLVRWAA
jgi:predicted amidohydrolase YtcJ